jgi:hypothetical protein
MDIECSRINIDLRIHRIHLLKIEQAQGIKKISGQRAYFISAPLRAKAMVFKVAV